MITISHTLLGTLLDDHISSKAPDTAPHPLVARPSDPGLDTLAERSVEKILITSDDDTEDVSLKFPVQAVSKKNVRWNHGTLCFIFRIL
jgi:hypothetical protein